MGCLGPLVHDREQQVPSEAWAARTSRSFVGPVLRRIAQVGQDQRGLLRRAGQLRLDGTALGEGGEHRLGVMARIGIDALAALAQARRRD